MLSIGIGNYSSNKGASFQLQPLYGSAIGAARFAEFVIDNFDDPLEIPLRTVRLLVSPAKDEEDLLPTAVSWLDASYENVDEALTGWGCDCHSDRRNIAILYVSGHGVVTTASNVQSFFLAGRGDLQIGPLPS